MTERSEPMPLNIFRVPVAWRRIFSRLALALVSTSICMHGLAATYPDHPVRLVVPSPTGGGTDTSTRIIAPRLAGYFGQQVVVDNRGGASGNIGAELVARAAPDGYTLLACIASHTSNPAVMKQVPYDFARDFAPISLTVTLPNVLVSHPSLPAHNVKELIALAR